MASLFAKPTSTSNLARIIVAFGLTLLTLSTIGCQDQSSADLIKIQTQMHAESNSTDSLQEAFRDLPKMTLVDRRVPTTEILRQLNAWASKQPADPNWNWSPLVDGLPELIRNSDWSKQLKANDFSEQQAEYMFQCVLMRNISSWVLQNPYRDSLFASWLEERKKGLDDKEAAKFENALKLFDWVVRNVTLEGKAKDIEKLPVSPYLPLSDSAPGYTLSPWQTVLRGRGDALARARVFSQLAFQANIPVAWIALPGNSDETPRLWALGIPVGKDIYVLEPRWGLPLPGPNQKGIATLQEAKDDATILRRATLVDQFTYPIAATDLAKTTLLLDVEPMAMGMSMQRLEKTLTGDLRVKLYADTQQWASQFTSVDPQLPIRLWSLPWLAQEYARELRVRLRNMDQFTASYLNEMAAYMDDTLLSRARQTHMKGSFKQTMDEEGALGQYLALRIPDATLEQLAYDPDLQKQMMLRRMSGEETPQFQTRIRYYQGTFRRAKLEGCLFLAMAHFDLGNYESARSWADRWTLQIAGTEPFHSSCWYLIGRSLEHLEGKEEAIEFYKKSPSPQEAGNRIRARLLQLAQ